MTDNDIIEYFKKWNRGCNWNNLPNNIKEYLINRYDDNISNTIKESYLRILNHIENIPKCPICGNVVKYKGRKNQVYNFTCEDNNCKNIYRLNKSIISLKNISKEKRYKMRQKAKQTCLEKYGIENYNNIEKIKETCLEKYGIENYLQTNEFKEKSKKTCLEKYGVEYSSQSENNKEKSKKTCLEKYGVEYSFQSENNKEKSKQTKLKKYGNKYYTNREKAKYTSLIHYGVDNPNKCKKIRNKINNTNLNLYGYINPFQNKEFIKRNTSKELYIKRNNTKRKNHTFNSSKPENESYQLLKEKYPDVEYQYQSKKYPFFCDFYIPSLDLYIECNYHWTHGDKIFENTIEDNIKLNNWKNKNNKFYQNAINTWTIRDPKKRQIVKENNLNWIEFFNINELKEWLNKYY